MTYVGPVTVQSVRVARRAAPDGRVLFDLVGEVTQSWTVNRNGELFDMAGGTTVIIDAQGEVRYAIYKRADTEPRQVRQLKSISGPLKKYWEKKGGKLKLRPGMLQRLHGDL